MCFCVHGTCWLTVTSRIFCLWAFIAQYNDITQRLHCQNQPWRSILGPPCWRTGLSLGSFIWTHCCRSFCFESLFKSNTVTHWLPLHSFWSVAANGLAAVSPASYHSVSSSSRLYFKSPQTITDAGQCQRIFMAECSTPDSYSQSLGPAVWIIRD